MHDKLIQLEQHIKSCPHCQELLDYLLEMARCEQKTRELECRRPESVKSGRTVACPGFCGTSYRDIQITHRQPLASMGWFEPPRLSRPRVSG